MVPNPRPSYHQQLLEINREIEKQQRVINEGYKVVESSSKALVQRWRSLLHPETDYDSDDEYGEEANQSDASSTCSSDYSFLTDSSDLSSDDEDDASMDQHLSKSHRKKRTNKEKVL